MLGVFFCASRQYAKQSVPCYGGPERSKRLQHKKRPENFKNATKAHKKYTMELKKKHTTDVKQK